MPDFEVRDSESSGGPADPRGGCQSRATHVRPKLALHRYLSGSARLPLDNKDSKHSGAQGRGYAERFSWAVLSWLFLQGPLCVPHGTPTGKPNLACRDRATGGLVAGNGKEVDGNYGPLPSAISGGASPSAGAYTTMGLRSYVMHGCSAHIQAHMSVRA